MRVEWKQIVRALLRERSYSVAVVLSLAIGIAANTAIYSLVEGVLLRELPLKNPDRLVAINSFIPKLVHLYPKVPVNLARMMEWRKNSKTMDGVAAYEAFRLTLGGKGEPTMIPAARVSSNLFSLLGVRPVLGRDFARAEDLDGHDKVAILSYELWQNQFHGDPAVVGKQIRLDDQAYDIVGVLPASLRFPLLREAITSSREKATPLVYKPFGWTPEQLQQFNGDFNYAAIARMKPGVTKEQFNAELNVIESQVDSRLKSDYTVQNIVRPLKDAMVEDYRFALLLVMSAVGAVLLILCLNLANLSISRSLARSRDFAIRSALGASPRQIVRESLVESLLLALVGGTLGVLLAMAGVDAALRFLPYDLPRAEDIGVNWRVLLFAAAASTLAGISFGLAPAFRSAMSDPQDALKGSSHTTTEGRNGIRIRNVLVTVEVALSVVLLVAAGLLINSFARLMNVDRGFDVDRVLSADISAPELRYHEKQDRAAYLRRVVEKAREIPGVTHAALVSAVPLTGETWIDIAGYENDPRPAFERLMVNVRFISPEYFETIGVHVKDGRTFSDGDAGRPVVILSATAARKLYPATSAVGRKIEYRDKPTVVGVAPDLRITTLDKDPVPIVYIPYWQRPRLSASVLVRTSGDPIAVASNLRRAIWEVDSQVPIERVRTLFEVMSRSVAARRFNMMLIGAFAVSALSLACLGIYGVVSYGVTRRNAELAIRMALGATTASIHKLVLVQGILPVLTGLAIGAIAVLAVSRLLTSALFGVKANDPLTYGAVLLLLMLAGVAACVVPAWRAGRIQPIRALRSE